jgi:hypothetical protein
MAFLTREDERVPMGNVIGTLNGTSPTRSAIVRVLFYA